MESAPPHTHTHSSNTDTVTQSNHNSESADWQTYKPSPGSLCPRGRRPLPHVTSLFSGFIVTLVCLFRRRRGCSANVRHFDHRLALKPPFGFTPTGGRCESRRRRRCSSSGTDGMDAGLDGITFCVGAKPDLDLGKVERSRSAAVGSGALLPRPGLEAGRVGPRKP